MEVGTLKSNSSGRKENETVSVIGGGLGNSNGSGGGNNNNNGGGSNHHDFYNSANTSNIPRIFTMFLLLVVLMTFGGLLGAYIVLATNGALEWRPFDLPYQVWISTAIILASSFTYHFSKKLIDENKQEKSKKWLLATTALGAAFISSQILAWFLLHNRGYYWSGNPYAGFFYILTAVHVVHVAGGICALGSIVLRTWNRTFSDTELKYRQNMANVVGWYWHFMDALWIVILFLLGFYK